MKIPVYELSLSNTMRLHLVKEREIKSNIGMINTPGSVSDLLVSSFHLDKAAEEFCYMLALSTGNKVMGIFMISKGTVNAGMLQPREVFIRALMCGATNIIIAHNHPDGCLNWSNADIDITMRLKEAGKLLAVPLSDHIIIGRNGCFSSAFQEGILENEAVEQLSRVAGI